MSSALEIFLPKIMSELENTKLAKSAKQTKQSTMPKTSNSSPNLEKVANKAEDECDKSNAQVPSADIKEIGGPKGLEPTRYGDWEAKGRCYDF